MHSRVLRFLTKKLWNEPAAIKGPVWTIAFLVALLLGGYYALFTMQQNANVAGPVLLFLICLWVMKRESKPKRLGKQLPYRRRR